jgi:streptogrisin B
MRIPRPTRVRTALAAVAAALTAATLLAAPTASAAGQPPTASRTAARTGTVSPRVTTGDVIYGSSGISCRAAINVRGGSTYYLVLAGHCAKYSTEWYTSPDLSPASYIGPTVGASFPGDDYGLVRYDNPAVPHPGSGFTSAGNAFVGEQVVTKTSTTGWHSGTVLATNATVDYGPDGVVSGLIDTNLCSEPGYPGTLLSSGSSVLGIFSGASGSCTSGGHSFYQPITEILAAYRVSIY